jgi:hypothetical protein
MNGAFKQMKAAGGGFALSGMGFFVLPANSLPHPP